MIVDIILLIWMHFIADFVLQTDKIATNKSKDNKILLLHVTLYSIPFFYFGWMYAIINAALHFVTDYFTSRWTAKLWADKEVHKFFVVIGFDQAIHISTLLLTYYIFIGK